MYFSVDSAEAKKISDKGTSLKYGTIGVKFLQADDFMYSVVISKKQGEAAERNRVKRAIRDYIRRREEYYPTGHFLVYYRGECDQFDREQVLSDLDEIMRKITFDKIQFPRQRDDYDQPNNETD